MKKTLIAIATLSTIISVHAQGITSSAELLNNGNTLLVDKRISVKQYPQHQSSSSSSSSAISVNVIEQPQETYQPTDLNNQQNVEPAHVYSETTSEIKRTGEISYDEAQPGYTPAKIEKVYTKKFLGIPYSPQNVVVEPAKPIFYGNLYFNNLTCVNKYNSGTIKLESFDSISRIPVVFCPSGKQTQLDLIANVDPTNTDKVVLSIGGQKVIVEKGFTSLYNLRYDSQHVVDFEFIFHQDEHPIRY